MSKREKAANGLGSLKPRGANGYYHGRLTIKGNLYTLNTKTADYEDALAKWKSYILPLQAEIDIEKYKYIQAKIDIQEERVEENEYEQRKVLWGEVFETYIKRGFGADLSKATLGMYEYNISRLYRWCKENNKKFVYIDDFTRSDAEEYLFDLRKTVSARLYNNMLHQLKWVWKLLEVKRNPFEKFKAMKTTKTSRRDLTVDEVKRILDYLKFGRKHEYNFELRVLVEVAIYTGMRLYDACHLQWSQIDFSRNVICISPHKTAKFEDNDVTLPMFPALRETLLEQKERRKKQIEEKKDDGTDETYENALDDYVVPYMLHQYENRAITARIRTLFNDCGIKTCERVSKSNWKPLVSFHSFRHFFVSMCANNNMPQNMLQKLVGHKSARMTSKYYHSDLQLAQHYIETLPACDSDDSKRLVDIKVEKGTFALIEAKRGTLTVAEYVKRLVAGDAAAIDIA